MPSLDLKTTFNTVASSYAEIRPGYPDELVRDVLDLSKIEKGGKLLEVGCGTGQATESFAAFGYDMTCLDIGHDLLSVAKRRLSHYKKVRFVLCAFEDWGAAGTFDLVISATAFRWVSPRVRFLRACDTLKPGGSLAIFSNQHIRRDQGFFAEVQEVYAKHYVVADSPRDPSKPTLVDSPEPGITAFFDPIHRAYPWAQDYSAEQYIKLLGTYSDHIALPHLNRGLLFDGVADLINRGYGGTITKHHETTLSFRRKRT